MPRWSLEEVLSLQNPARPRDADSEEVSSRLRNRRILAVVNPVAGPSGVTTNLRDLIERAQKLGVTLQVVETRADLNGEQAVAATPGEFDCYLAVGGDGTVKEVAEAAMKNGVPLAILPRGTANAVAWHFGLPFDLARALRVAAQGRTVEIDLAEAAGHKFLIVAGLGYDAHVIRDATRVLKRRFGFLAYLYAALKNLTRSPYSFRVSLDGREPFRVRGATAVIANIGTLAGNIRLIRPVSPLDGKLDLIVISPANFRDFFRMLLKTIVGRLQDDPRLHYYQASSIRIDCRPPAPLEIDGTGIEGPHRELEAHAIPRALTVMVPPEGMWKVRWMPDVNWSPSFPKSFARDGR